MRPFLRQTFLARGSGFHFTADPPPGIRDRVNLASHDLDLVLGCVLANLQHGAFDVLTTLTTLLHRSSDYRVWDAATTLIGYAAPMSCVRNFVAQHAGQGGDFVRHQVHEVAVSAGGWWIVPSLLTLHAQVQDLDARRFCQNSLSWLLEAEYGSIMYGPDELPPTGDPAPFHELEPELDFDSYRTLVQERLADLRQAHALAADSVLVEGEPLHLQHVAQRLLTWIRAGAPGARIENARMLLEACTGIDCRDFYDSNGILRPLSAAAVVEDFLVSGQAAKYMPGVRYFFGHQVPQE